MIENSPIYHKTISNSFSKLQKVASDGRFRVKSFRVKTTTNEFQDHLSNKLGLPLISPNRSIKKFGDSAHRKIQSPAKGVLMAKIKIQSCKIIQKDYEQQLNSIGLSSQFLKKLFQIKSQEGQNKPSQQRYTIFIKNLCLRLCKSKYISINNLGFGPKAVKYFFEWFVAWDGHVNELDFSFTGQTLKDTKMERLIDLLTHNKQLMNLVLCNSGIDGKEISQIFTLINNKKQLFSLDLSNLNSQSLNRFGQQISSIEKFVLQNQSVAILKLNNMQLKREGLQMLWKGLTQKRENPLRLLSLSNNYIHGAKVCQYFSFLCRSGLLYLNFSNNPLGEDFYKNLPLLKGTTVREIDLSCTNMSSENLYEFFERIQDSKTLITLKFDDNDFSHHWFGKIGQKIETNHSLEYLSLNNCQIKSFMPLFQGLTLNKYLKKLHANNNIVDCQNQLLNRVKDCFIYNKDLQELRMKFCNLDEKILVTIFEGLEQNKKLKILDISQNLLQDSGVNAILKMLEENSRIEYLGIQRLPISKNLKRRIQSKINENKVLREKGELQNLKKVTCEMRGKDKYTWDDVESYQNEEKSLTQKAMIVEKKIAKLETIVETKRQRLNKYIKECNEEEKRIENQIKNKLRMMNERVRDMEKEVQEMERKEQIITKQHENQKERIMLLQNKIRIVNETIKSKENQLEDTLRNHKYLQKKNGRGHSLSLSKKNSNTHLHGITYKKQY